MCKSSVRSCIAGLALGAFISHATAYELGTHQRLTDKAVARSILADPASSPLGALGVVDPLKESYSTSAIQGESQRVTALRLPGWGARFEDGTGLERVLNHFMDPQQNGKGLLTGHPSASWVLEDQGDISGQDFSLKDALGSYWLALSGQWQATRDQQFVLLMEGVGRGVHHLQDMSQPAHTRDDSHMKILDGDFYEFLTEKKFAAEPLPGELVYGSNGVDLHEFDTARKFWINAGKGMAEFTSRNFVSKDTNFRGSPASPSVDPEHPLPTPASQSSLTLAEVSTGLQSQVPVYFYGVNVQDQYSGQTFLNPRASSFSIIPPTFSLNRANFQSNYQILLPRTLAYSTGLINYFFRGRLQVDAFTLGASQASVTVRNVSAAEFALKDAAAANTAEFAIFYESTSGERKPIPSLPDADLGGTEMAHNSTRTFTFAAPGDLDRTHARPFTVAFNGIIGNEAGIAAAAVGTAQAAFLVTPNYVPADGIAGARVISWNGSRWTLTPQAGVQAGGVDWRGNDGEVLTWGGGRGRYFQPQAGAVYRQGTMLTGGPVGAVLGASTRMVNGQKHLNVAIVSWDVLKIYSRVFATSYSDEAMWSPTNPLGWREVYTGTHGLPFTHFMFNASGTEGQYITQHPEGGPDKRVKVLLSNFTAQASVFPASATVTNTEQLNEHREYQLKLVAGTCVVNSFYPQGTMQPGSQGNCVGYDNAASARYTTTTTRAYVDKTVLCADYLGDTEVFCTVEAEVTATPSVRVFTRDEGMNYITDYFSMGTCPDGRRMARASEVETVVNKSMRQLKVGSRSIPWVGSEGSGGRVHQYSGDVIYGDGFFGSLTYDSSGTLFATTLLYADARVDALVYEQKVTRSRLSGMGPIREPSDGYLNTTEKVHNETETRVVAALGGADVTLFSNMKTSDAENLLRSPQGTLGETWVPCAAQNSDINRPATITTTRDAQAKATLLSSMVYYGSYAIAPNGAYALSQWIQISGIAETPQKNALTNGDLTSLLPGTPPAEGASYTIKVIR